MSLALSISSRKPARARWQCWISWLLLALSAQALCGQALAAPAVRFFTQPPDNASSVSRFTVVAELYETSTGNRIVISGVSVGLRLLRCPGFPASCTVVVVDNAFASSSSSAGLITFSGLTIDSAADDYYFATSASGYSSSTSDVFDVGQAVLSFDTDIPVPLSSASRFPLTVSVLRGPGEPRDLLADSLPLRLALYRCPGFPGSCSVVIVDTNFANATANNGVATFSGLNLDSAADDYYLYVTLAPTANGNATGRTSNVVDVRQAVLTFDNDIPQPLSTASRFPLTVSVLQGPGLPRDTLADSLPLRLALYRCPGYPASCSVVVVDTDFANATANNGVATFSGLNLDSAADDYYAYVSLAPTAQGAATGQTSNVVDVDSSRLVVTSLPTTQLSTASRLPLRVEVWRGVGTGSAIDPHADSVPLRLGLYECPGYPASCSVNILNSNFANATAFNGVAQFNNLRVTGVGDDRYFYASAPGSTGTLAATSQVFDVDQAFARIMSPTPDRAAQVPFSLDVAVLAGGNPAAPIDTLAGGITLRLDSYSCPGFPSACTPVLLQTGFGQAVSVAGVAEVSGLSYAAPGEDRFLQIRAPSDSSVGATTSGVFDVLAAPPEIFANGFEQP